MKKMLFLFIGIIIVSVYVQYVCAQQSNYDFELNIELMNRVGDVYVVTKCRPNAPTYVLAKEDEYICSKSIVPGTIDAKICNKSFFATFGIEEACCRKE